MMLEAPTATPFEAKQTNAGYSPSPRVGRVLVLGAEYRMVLPIARSLGRRGIEVHIAGVHTGCPSRWSRYVRQVHELRAEPTAQTFAGEMQNLIDQHHYDLVIPATEEFLLPIQADAAMWHDTPMFLLNEDAFAVTVDKSKTDALARALGIPVPKTITVADTAELESIDLPCPLFVKPCTSARNDDVRKKAFACRVNDRETLLEYGRRLLTSGAVTLVQQLVEGTGVGVNIIAREGKVLKAFQHSRLHETNGCGSTYRVSEPLEEKLLDATKKLMAALNYTGVAMVEFRVNRETGKWYLMEINGRFWGSLPLAVAAGADFPRYLYQLLIEEKESFPQDYRVGVRCRDLYADLRWTWRSLRRKRPDLSGGTEQSLGWFTNPISSVRLLGDMARGCLLRDRIDSFAIDDPLPLIGEITNILRKTMLRWTRGEQEW